MRYFILVWCGFLCVCTSFLVFTWESGDKYAQTGTISTQSYDNFTHTTHAHNTQANSHYNQVKLPYYANQSISLESSLDSISKDSIFTPKHTLSLVMVGDALLHTAVYEDGKAIESNLIESKSKDDANNKKAKQAYKYDFTHMLKDIKPLISNYDLAFYNQESILGGVELNLSSYPAFNSPQEFGNAMLDSGFNLISLANNHTLDKGQKGVLSSLSYWQEKEKEGKILTAGSYNSFDSRDSIKIMQKNGITYTLLAYTYGTNGIPLPKGKEYLVNVYTKEMLEKDIKAARDKVDLLMVSMHWGDEYVFKPNKEQKELAKLLANAGVDIIIGHHPHVVQPIEFIGDSLVVYSLGNMLSGQKGLERKIGMIVGLDVIKNNALESKKIEIKDVKMDFIYTHHDEKMQNFRVIPFSSLTDSILPKHKDIFKEYIGKINMDKQEVVKVGF